MESESPESESVESESESESVKLAWSRSRSRLIGDSTSLLTINVISFRVVVLSAK